MNVLKRFFSFYNNVIDIHNIDVITRKEYGKYLLSTLIIYAFLCSLIYTFAFITHILPNMYQIHYRTAFLICIGLLFSFYIQFLFVTLKRFINGNIPVFLIFILPFLVFILFSFAKDDLDSDPYYYVLIYVIYILYNIFLIILALTVKTADKQNNILKKIMNKKTIYKYLILPFNLMFMLDVKGRITRLQYIISLLFSIFAPLFLMIISYGVIQGLKYIYSSLFNMPVDDIFNSLILIGIVFLFYVSTVIVSGIFLIILRINDIIKSKIIKVVMYIVTIFVTTYPFRLIDDLKRNTIYFLIIIAIPVLFKSRNIEDNNLTAKGSE